MIILKENLDQKKILLPFLNFPKFEYSFLCTVSYVPILQTAVSYQNGTVQITALSAVVQIVSDIMIRVLYSEIKKFLEKLFI